MLNPKKMNTMPSKPNHVIQGEMPSDFAKKMGIVVGHDEKEEKVKMIACLMIRVDFGISLLHLSKHTHNEFLLQQLTKESSLPRQYRQCLEFLLRKRWCQPRNASSQSRLQWK